MRAFAIAALGHSILVPALPAQDAPVAATERFVFYSRFPLNLHDAIQRVALGEPGLPDTCLAARPEREQSGWRAAVEAYMKALGSDGRGMPIAVRFHLAGLVDQVRGGMDPMPEAIRTALDQAAPAYRACQWPHDDEANRAWIQDLVSRLEMLGDEVATRLAGAYQTSWRDDKIPVDVVGFVSAQGANTVRPPHILINSRRADHGGDGALESIFHEASHTIISPRGGGPIVPLRDAAARLGVEVPRGLWHVILFYTTGEVVRRVIAERTGRDYQQYLYATGLFRRAWPELRAPVERWWPRYLNGEISMDAAIEGLLRAIEE